MGKQHKFALHRRGFLNGLIGGLAGGSLISATDVLVTRGNWDVVTSVANNDGARLSDFGFLHMIKRAEGDSILAEQLGLRNDIPRQLFQQLIAKASDDVRKRLERERPAMVAQIQSTMTDVAGSLQSKFGPVSRSYFVAKRVVTTQHRLAEIRRARRFWSAPAAC